MKSKNCLNVIVNYVCRYQWEEEIRNNIPDIPVTRIFVQTKSKEQLPNPLVLITSYDLMARTGDQLVELKFGVIIMVRLVMYFILDVFFLVNYCMNNYF